MEHDRFSSLISIINLVVKITLSLNLPFLNKYVIKGFR